MSLYKGNTEIAKTRYIKPTGTIEITENGEYDVTDYATAIINVEAPQPSISTGGLFTGATIPLTYKDNTHDYENNYEYKSASYNITITGLDNEAEIIGNGTREVKVNFNVSSSTSSLTPFTITLSDGTNTYTYNGLHAHYGQTVTGILTFAYTNIAPTGIGTIGTEYKFIASSNLPVFTSESTLWNTIYPYQVLNVLIGNWSSNSIGNYFLGYCYSFNQPLTIPNTVTSISGSFLRDCYSFNQLLTIPNTVTSIDASFLHQCYSFNQPLIIPNSVTSISNYFLRDCRAFNQPLTISNNITSIGNYFLYNCYSFNQPLTMPSSVTSIGNGFLGACYAFNQPLTIPNSVTSIGSDFLYQCYSFNQPLTIPNTVTSISGSFLYNCYSFNQPLTIPNTVTSISGSFLYNCYSFNQPLTIPNTVTSIGNSFLQNCYSLSTIIYESAVYPTDNNSLAQGTNSKTSTNGAGIKVYGTHRTGLIAALPDRTSSPYRKFIDGGY